jgi:hypothetical protein
MAKKPFYSKTPVVPEKQIAGKNPIPGPELGGQVTSPTVPRHQGFTKAFGPHVKTPHGYGHAPHAKQGHLRMSGVPTAHRLGASGIRKTPVVNRP